VAGCGLPSKHLSVPFGVREATWGNSLDIQVGECWSCGPCDECGRAYSFWIEEHDGYTYLVHYLDTPPEPMS
jgi:hypothetical protein